MTSWANFSQLLATPNGLSVLRGIIGIGLPFLLISRHSLLHLFAFFLFIFGVWLDYLDGILARRYSLVTHVGKFVDPVADKILILAPLSTFAYAKLFSPWWLVPIFLREIIVTFCRIGWLLEGKALAAERLGKIKLGFQVASVLGAFFYFFSMDFSLSPFLIMATKTLMFLSLILTIALTLISGASFLYTHQDLFRSVEFAQYTSAFGVGLIPVIPGTWGSALGIAIVLLIQWNPWLYLATFAFLVWVGYWAVSRLDLVENKDPNFVVADEVCAVLVCFAGIPLTPATLLTGFLLFRLFDVAKPYPLRRLEKLPGYWGILTDDLGAGVYVWLVLKFFFHG